MNKRLLSFILCLLMILSIPLSSLAEPQPWLQPWLNLYEKREAPLQGELKISLSPDGIEALMQKVLDASLSSYLTSQTFMGMNEDDVAVLTSQYRLLAAAEMKTLSNNAKALSALLKVLSIRYALSDDILQFHLIFQQQPIARFALVFQEGAPLLLSDLFPSYALTLTKESIDSFLTLFSIYLNVSFESAEEASENQAADLKQLLTLLNGYSLLEGLVETGRTELEALAENGHATRQRGKITFTGREEDKLALLEEMELSFAPEITALEAFLEALNAEAEETIDSVEGEGLVFEALKPVETAAVSEEKPFTHTYSINGDTLRIINTRMLENTVFEEIKNPKTGAVTRKSSVSQWENRQQLIITPTSMEFSALPAAGISESLSIDASQPHVINAAFQMRDSVDMNGAALQLSRTEEGQQLTFTLNTSAPAPIDLRLAGDWKNDILSQMHFSIETQIDNQWLPVSSFSLENTEQELDQSLSLDGRTIISPNRRGEYSDAGYKKEFANVGKRNLNLVVLTRLPADARPLMSVLLSIIGLLGQ